MKILLLGSYGNLGKEILKLLCDKGLNVTILGKNENLLKQQSKENVEYVCDTIENFDGYSNFNLVINCTNNINYQENLLKKIEKADTSFFDCHSPAQINYNLLEKYKFSKNTYVFDCGATSFLPFLQMLKVENELSILAHFKTCWSNRNLSQQNIDEYLTIHESNQILDCTLVDGNWIPTSTSQQKKFDIGYVNPIPNYELKVAKENFSNINTAGFYMQMDEINLGDEYSKIIIQSENQKLTIKTFSGYYYSACLVVSAILQDLNLTKTGSYLMGDYVDSTRFLKELKFYKIEYTLE